MEMKTNNDVQYTSVTLTHSPGSVLGDYSRVYMFKTPLFGVGGVPWSLGALARWLSAQSVRPGRFFVRLVVWDPLQPS